MSSDKIQIYNVEDSNDYVARKLFEKNKFIYDLCMSAEYELREKNIDIYIAKQKKK